MGRDQPFHRAQRENGHLNFWAFPEDLGQALEGPASSPEGPAQAGRCLRGQRARLPRGPPLPALGLVAGAAGAGGGGQSGPGCDREQPLTRLLKHGVESKIGRLDKLLLSDLSPFPHPPNLARPAVTQP